MVLNHFDAQSFDAQPFAPHVGHSPPLIPSPLQVSQGDIFNGVERILVVRCATLIIFFKIYGQKYCCVEREINVEAQLSADEGFK